MIVQMFEQNKLICYSNRTLEFKYKIFQMEEILSSGKYLGQFEADCETEIFQDAQTLPQFLENNLLDDSRVIKSFKYDPQANIRVFYYQYLKLCFESPHYELYTQKIQQFILNPQFSFLFCEEDDPELFNDKQFKRIIIEFFDYMSQGQLNVHKALNKFPILDLVLIYFFRTLLILTKKTQSFDSYIDKEVLFDFLTSEFSVEASVHEKCLKFEETDIFVYEDSPENVFMIYIDYEALPIQYSEPLSEQLSGQGFTGQTQALRVSNLCPVEASPEKKIQQTIKVSQQAQISATMTENIEKRRLEKLTYLGNSEIYDFIDYTNPKNKPSELSLGQDKKISKVSYMLPTIVQKQDFAAEKNSIGSTSNEFTTKIVQSQQYWKIESVPEKNHESKIGGKDAQSNYVPNSYNPTISDSSIRLFQSNQRSQGQYSEIDSQNKYQFSINNYSFVNTKSVYHPIDNKDEPYQSKTLIEYQKINSPKYPDVSSNYGQVSTTNKEPESHFYPLKSYVYGNNLVESESNKKIAQSDFKKNTKAPFSNELVNSVNVTLNYPSQSDKRSKNISEEMTNSFTLEKIIEPHRTNIKAMKVRARTNRKALQNFLITK